MTIQNQFDDMASVLDAAFKKAASGEARVESLRNEVAMLTAAALQSKGIGAMASINIATKATDDLINARPALEKSGHVKTADDFAKQIADGASSFIKSVLDHTLSVQKSLQYKRADQARGITRK